MPEIVTIKVEGLADLEAAMIRDLPNSAAKAVLRRVALASVDPMLTVVREMAPADDPGGTPERPANSYRNSWIKGTRLNKRQRRMAKREGKSNVEVYVGTPQSSLGTELEFGTSNRVQKTTSRETGQVTARPHARPAWQATAPLITENLRDKLWAEIQKTTQRLARKAAKLAGRG